MYTKPYTPSFLISFILPILNLLDLVSLNPFLDVAIGGWCRDAEGGGEVQIGLAIKGFREGVEKGLLTGVGYGCFWRGFFDLREGAENLVDVDYEDIADGQGGTEVGLCTGQGRREVACFEDSQGGENQDYPEGGETEATDGGNDVFTVTVKLTGLDGGEVRVESGHLG